MAFTCFELSIEERVAHLIMNRPDKRNSMVPEFWEELPAIIRDIDENAKARVIVISSTGPHFSAGMDTAAFSDNTLTGDEADATTAGRQHGARLYETIKRLQGCFTALEACRIPVISAIQGGCIGGAVDLVTACDMRYATEDAFITIFETNIGMTADVGTFPRICKLIPDGLARELAYTGRRMPAAEARRIGLVNAVYPDQVAMLAAVMTVAREIASKAPLAVYGIKRMMNHARDNRTADSLDYIALWNASMLKMAEIQEAMQAAGENREGQFVDLPKVAR